MTVWLGVAAAVLGALGVAAGAFGAHALKGTLIEHGTLDTWRTAATYHLVHSVALLAVALLWRQSQGTSLAVAGWAFVVGIFCFSGSLYALALGGPGFLGPVTPLGGVAFITGWVALVVALRPT